MATDFIDRQAGHVRISTRHLDGVSCTCAIWMLLNDGADTSCLDSLSVQPLMSGQEFL